MPYTINEDLAPSVRDHLPPRAQDIYRETFNHAWTTYAHNPRHEEIAHRTAWAAVKRQFHKDVEGQWHPNDVVGSRF
jgi:cation transport regulator